MDFKVKAEQLRNLLTTYQRAYYTTGRALVSDTEYDRLFDELTKIEEAYPELKTEDSPTNRVGSDLSSDFPEVEHSIAVLSLDKAYTDGEILSYIDKTRKESSASFVLEEKIDGFSIVLYYENGLLRRAVTRGNGFIGNDVTSNVKTIKSVPLRLTKPIDIAVRGEIYLPKEDFEAINSTLTEPYANPRNLAAGTIRRNKSSETAKVPLSIFCYEGFWNENTPFSDHIQILSELKRLGFKVDPNISYFCKTKEEAELRLKEADLEGKPGSFEDIPQEIAQRTKTRSSLGYEIDGLVVKVNELSIREELGYTEHHPRWAIAYKFESPQAVSVVLDIDTQTGRTGRITPMARIKETELSGSVIKNVTLHNQDYVDSLEIAVGDTVAISKRGDVIPAVESVIEKNTDGNTTFKMPETCPSCGSLIEKRGAHHFCTGTDCPAQEKGKLEFFCAKKQMDIEGLGPKTLEILYDKHYIRQITDIYRFDFQALIRDRVDGFGEKKVRLIEDGIKESKNKDFRHVLVSVGIADFGKKAVDLVCSAGFNSFEKLFALADMESNEEALAILTKIDGIGPLTAQTLLDALKTPQLRQLVKEFNELGLAVSEDTTENSNANTLEQIFKGQTWCVTGTFDNFSPRDKAMEELVKRGAVEVSSVSSKTSGLLTGKNAGSKLAKAQALGIRVMFEDELMSIISKDKPQPSPVSQEQPSLF